MKLIKCILGAALLACTPYGAGSAAAQDNQSFDLFTGNGFLVNCSQTPNGGNGFRLGIQGNRISK